MKIRSVEYAGSIARPDGPKPASLPEVAFSGRSNVGKSSLINTLVRRTRHRIAEISSRPGKTRSVDFFRVNDRFFLVDLPGFGYARVPDHIRTAWGPLVEGYLESSEALRGVVHLVDARHRPTGDDRRMIEYLAEAGLPTLVVMTKIDKLSRSRRRPRFREIRDELEITDEQLLPFSAKTGEGRRELLEAIEALLAEGEEATSP